jgi:hypothetical protein
MTVLLILLVLVPWSIYRQMQVNEVNQSGLIKLPLIFAAIGVLGFGLGSIPTDGPAVGYLALSVAISVGLGIWRGVIIPIWTSADGKVVSQGNRATLSLWILLLASKIAMGTVASITGWFPGEHAGEIFLFIAVSFAAQNLVVAKRTQGMLPAPTTVNA